MRRLMRAFLFPALAMAAMVWAGCQGKGDGEDGYRCNRDPSLLSEQRDCFEDDDCPCGSHCGLGQCSFECASDGDCGDGLGCDALGRCSADGALVAPIDVAPSGRVRVVPTRLQLAADGGVSRISLSVEGHDSGPVRVAAGAGTELRCGSGDEFAAQCELANLSPAGEPVAIGVRATAQTPPAADEQSDIGVFANDQRISVSVRHLAPGEPQVGPRPMGVYRGFVWPIVAGSKSRSHVEKLPSEMTDIRLPIEMHVFAADGDAHPVRIVDSFGLLFPDGDAAARLVYGDDGRWRLKLPAWHLAGPPDPGKDDVEVWVPATLTDVVWAGEYITAELETVFAGATTDEYAPFLVWQISASWSEDLGSGASAPRIDRDYEPAQLPARGASALSIEPLVRSALSNDLAELTLGGTSSQWAQATICTAQGEGSPTMLAPTILQVDGADSPAGDLACGEAGGVYPPPTFGLMTSNLLAVNENIATCLSDLAQVQAAIDGADPDAPLATDGCIAAGRVITALGHATEKDRARAFGEFPLPEFPASAVGLRLVQQWLDMHAFVAREANQVQQLNDILDPDSSDNGPVGQEFTVSEAMAVAVDGWDLVLHPRFAVPLSAIPTKVLLSPDYRGLLYPQEAYPDRRSYTQSVGVPASMLDALGIELRVMSSLVDQAQRGLAEREEIEALLGRVFRRTAVIVSFAHALHTAAAATADPPWEEHWQSSRQGAASAIRELMRAVERLREGRNPLGIEDVDLPLYRVGDQGTASQRFSALSDYLLGTTDDGVAQYMTGRAGGELEAAREAWYANVERDLAAQLEGFERERRLEAIGGQFGGVITSLCGNPAWDSATVLEIWDQVDANTCYVAEDCQPTADDVREQVTTASIGATLCIASRLRQRFGPTINSGDPAFDQLLDDMANMFAVPRAAFPFRVSGVAETDDDVVVSLQEIGGSFVAPISIKALSAMRMGLPAQAAPEVIEKATLECDRMRLGSEDARPDVAPMDCALADDCPVGSVCTTGTCAPDPGEELADRPACYRGALGSQALAVRSAGREVTKARSELTEFTEKYDIAMRSCIITQVGQASIRQATENHNIAMTVMGGVKLVADIAAAAAETAMTAASAAAPWSVGAATAVGVGKIVADTASLGIAFAMETTARFHQQNIQSIEHDIVDRRCFNDAEMELVGARTAAVRIQQASIDLARQMVELNNLKGQVTGAAVEGHQALEAEIGRRATPITTDFWLNEDVDRYRRYLRQARRAVYLAVLAVEYEFQFTSMARMDVLAARTPGALQDVIDEMRAYTLTGTVGGGSPSDRLTVVSLRDHLIQMADRSNFPDGWHQLSAPERFRVLLSAPVYSIYDDGGEYLGQEIPFTITPVGSLELGESQGIPLLAGTDCAERLWSVNASLLGEDLYSGSDTTFATVVLRKRNTFYSQWCADDDTMDPFQVASTRPTRNLFLDPLDFEGSNTMLTPQPDATVTDEINAYTNARISAYFNVPRAELEDESYFNGDSQELAGRGLFGDFALFFPVQTLSLEQSEGLRLANIDDILLRLDYVSVARGG